MDMMHRRGMLIAAAKSSGLRYDLQTKAFASGSDSITVDRKFQKFILIAEVSSSVDISNPGNNRNLFICFVYPGSWIASSGQVHTIKYDNSSTPRKGVVGKPAQLSVGETTITVTAYTTSNNVVGDWNILQIELPDDGSIYPLG